MGRKNVLVFRELPPDSLALLQAVHNVVVAKPREPAQQSDFDASLPIAMGLIGSSLRIDDALPALRAAGLDVFAVEPLPLDSPLRRHPKVTCLPSIGSATHETRHALAQSPAAPDLKR
ncbi:MAG: hypothetical protein H7322_13135 [Ramlibacter sp.]|nr:hypothetical protein [Ramlibacter sp.]